jgi:beta-glucanase (GH16 family)
MASSPHPTMRLLLLLLTAVLSIHCKVKESGLAGIFGDGSTSSPPDAVAPVGDGIALGAGGQEGVTGIDGASPASNGGSAGNQGAGGTPGSLDAQPTHDAASPTASGGSGGRAGAPGLGGASLPLGGNTGGKVGPSDIDLLDAGAAMADAAQEDTRPYATPDLPADNAPDVLADLVPDLPAAAEDTADAQPVTPDSPGLPLLWQDEFDGPKGTAVDPGKWEHVLWAPNTVNAEKQQYTDSLDNVFLDGEGHVVIRALKSGLGYTSGRIDTQGKFEFKTGRLEVRAKLPAGAGSFPGIIALGTQGIWPACGELALMEQYGQPQDKSWFYAGAYADGSPGSGDKRNNRHDFLDATTASTDFHIYSVDWSSNQVVFQVDGVEITRTSFGTSSPFSSIPEFITLDVAVGGNMGGDIDPNAFPMDMVVDYVRVYSLGSQ